MWLAFLIASYTSMLTFGKAYTRFHRHQCLSVAHHFYKSGVLTSSHITYHRHVLIPSYCVSISSWNPSSKLILFTRFVSSANIGILLMVLSYKLLIQRLWTAGTPAPNPLLLDWSCSQPESVPFITLVNRLTNPHAMPIPCVQMLCNNFLRGISWKA